VGRRGRRRVISNWQAGIRRHRLLGVARIFWTLEREQLLIILKIILHLPRVIDQIKEQKLWRHAFSALDF
jgi:hypothetical protein